VLCSIDWSVFRTILGANIIQCQTEIYFPGNLQPFWWIPICSLFDLEMNGPDVIAMYCTRFQQILIGEREKNLKPEVSIEDKRIKKKYGHISIKFFITPVLSCYCSSHYVLERIRMVRSDKVALKLLARWPPAIVITFVSFFWRWWNPNLNTGFNGWWTRITWISDPKDCPGPLRLYLQWLALSFFLSWVVNTQLNPWTKWVVGTHLIII